MTQVADKVPYHWKSEASESLLEDGYEMLKKLKVNIFNVHDVKLELRKQDSETTGHIKENFQIQPLKIKNFPLRQEITAKKLPINL